MYYRPSLLRDVEFISFQPADRQTHELTYCVAVRTDVGSLRVRNDHVSVLTIVDKYAAHYGTE